jgi:tetratricopeptide (TPR) repeat protein
MAKPNPKTIKASDKPNLPNFKLWLALVVLVVFANSIPNGYALDDEFYTNGGNKLTEQGIDGIPEIFTTRTFYNPDGSGYSFRPVAAASFAIEHSFFGTKAAVSHIINLLLYLVTVLLLFSLLKKWFTGYSPWILFFIVMLFAVHPLHTEVVDNIKCRDEILAHLFALLSIWAVFKHIETGKWWYMVIYPLLFLAGILSKNTAIPYFAVFVMVLYFFSGLKPAKIALYFLPLLLIPVLIFANTKMMLPKSKRELMMHENPFLGTDFNYAYRSATSFYILMKYLVLQVFPQRLLYYYGYSYVPVVSWSNPLAIISLLVHAALGIYAVTGLRSKSVISFGILLYLVFILPYSNLLRTAPGMMAERFAYGASFAFCLLVVMAVYKLFKLNEKEFSWQGNYQKAGYFFIGIALLFSIRSIARNEVWESKLSLYSNDMPYLEESAKANGLYGVSLMQIAIGKARNTYAPIEGNERVMAIQALAPGKLMDMAQAHLEKAITIFPNYKEANNNLGSVYYFKGNYAKALERFKIALQMDSLNKEALFNIGMSENKLGNKQAAIEAFEKALLLDPANAAAQQQLAMLKAANETAVKPAPVNNKDVLQKEIDKNIGKSAPLFNMGMYYINLKDTATAITYFEQAEVIGDNEKLPRLLYKYYKSKGNKQKSDYYYNRVMQYNKK